MESYSAGLLICGVSVSMYQMSGTPFVLNLLIFCSILLICIYAMIVSHYRLPSDALFRWIYSKKDVQDEDENDLPMDHHDDQITKKLRELTGHIVRDFILSWYNTVTDDVAFVQEAFELFDHLLMETRARVTQTEKKRLLVNVLSEFLKHVVMYKKAAQQLETKGIASNDDHNRRNQLIAVIYYAERNHPALDSLPDSEMEYLRGIVALVLKGLLPKDYKLNETPLYLVRELIAQNVLNSVVNLTSDPLWIYNTIADILDQETDSNEAPQLVPDDSATLIVDMLEDYETSSHDGSDFGSVPNENEMAESDSLGREDVVAPSQSCISVSHSSSVTSQLSDDSLDFSELPNVNNMDVPLPLLSSEMHFAPDRGESDLNPAGTSLSTVAERPLPDRLFHRIRIPEYTVMKENFDASKKYVLYKISFKTKEKVPSRTLSAREIRTSESSVSQTDEASFTGQEEMVTRSHQVQRRFREFLALQERLSQNMVAKNLIGEIKGPSRMFPVPFGNMDKKYIELRKKFLQAYLRKICSIPFISKTKEVREFLAYEMDPRIAFVKKPDSIPRFDQIFKSAIQDLFGSASMKFPSVVTNKDSNQAFQAELDNHRTATNSETDPFPNGEVSNIGAVAKLRNKVFGHSKHHAHDKTSTAKTSRQFASFEGQRPRSSRWKGENEVEISVTDSQQENIFEAHARGLGDGCDAASTAEEDTNSEVSPSDIILKLVLKVWQVTPGRHGLATVALMKYIEAYLSDKVEELTTKQAWTKYLDVLHNALWPGGEWESSGSVRQTWATASEEVKNIAVTRAETCLKQALPDALHLLMSEEEYDIGTKLLVESLQNININRLLIYRLVDLIISELFPDVDRVSQCNHVSLRTHTSTP